MRSTTVDAVVFNGGPRPPAESLEGLETRLVLAVDLGLEHATAMGWRVDVAVGDFDSASPAAVRAAEAAGVEVLRFPEDKDRTDLDLALDEAVRRGARSLLVVAGDGPTRVDHQLASMLTLAAPHRAGLAIEARLGQARLWPVHDRRRIGADRGSTVSLVPVGGPVTVRTEGLRWPLRGERLEAGSTRGVSNLVDEDPFEVAVEGGRLLVVAPGPE
jgi:thiamine pyrophosphokinase